MSAWLRGLTAAGLILIGAVITAGGTWVIVAKALELLTVVMSFLWAHGPTLFELDPRPVPQADLFWPALALIGGVLAFLVGWVAIVRGLSIAWPARFDRSQRDAS